MAGLPAWRRPSPPAPPEPAGGRRVAPRARAGGAGRVIAGTARGHVLVAPGEGTRPLGDRVKQTLFAILEPAIRERAFLDLFAGSGAAGIEALSRGAERAVFVDRDEAAVETIRRNLQATHLAGGRAEVHKAVVNRWLREHARARGPFAAALVDPPYDRPELLDEALAAIDAAGPGGILTDDGVVVAKHFAKAPPAEVRLLRSVRERRFGETTLTFLRWVPSAPGEEEDG
jgi:16S rRNA (guanine966-N2)-methyltransferase